MNSTEPPAVTGRVNVSEPDGPVCEHCNGDGMDPMCDYLMPCKHCQGERQP